MPRYDYRCPKNHVWELIHSIADCDLRHRCPTCKGDGKRQIGTTFANNLSLTDKELKSLEFPLGKKNLRGVKTVGDVDRVLRKINAQYKWTGGFGR